MVLVSATSGDPWSLAIVRALLEQQKSNGNLVERGWRRVKAGRVETQDVFGIWGRRWNRDADHAVDLQTVLGGMFRLAAGCLGAWRRADRFRHRMERMAAKKEFGFEEKGDGGGAGEFFDAVGEDEADRICSEFDELFNPNTVEGWLGLLTKTEKTREMAVLDLDEDTSLPKAALLVSAFVKCHQPVPFYYRSSCNLRTVGFALDDPESVGADFADLIRRTSSRVNGVSHEPYKKYV